MVFYIKDVYSKPMRVDRARHSSAAADIYTQSVGDGAQYVKLLDTIVSGANDNTATLVAYVLSKGYVPLYELYKIYNEYKNQPEIMRVVRDIMGKLIQYIGGDFARIAHTIGLKPREFASMLAATGYELNSAHKLAPYVSSDVTDVIKGEQLTAEMRAILNEVKMFGGIGAIRQRMDKFDALNKQTEELKKQISAVNAASVACTTAAKSEASNLTELKTKMEVLQKQADTLDADKRKLLGEIEVCRTRSLSDTESATGALKAAEARAVECASKSAALETRLADIEKQAAKLDMEKKVLETTVKTLDWQIKVAEGKRDNFYNELMALKSRGDIGATQTELAKAQAEILAARRKAEQDAEQYAADMAKCAASKTQYERDLTALRSQMGAANTQVVGLEERVKQLDAKMRDLDAKYKKDMETADARAKAAASDYKRVATAFLITRIKMINEQVKALIDTDYTQQIEAASDEKETMNVVDDIVTKLTQVYTQAKAALQKAANESAAAQERRIADLMAQHADELSAAQRRADAAELAARASEKAVREDPKQAEIIQKQQVEIARLNQVIEELKKKPAGRDKQQLLSEIQSLIKLTECTSELGHPSEGAIEKLKGYQKVLGNLAASPEDIEKSVVGIQSIKDIQQRLLDDIKANAELRVDESRRRLINDDYIKYKSSLTQDALKVIQAYDTTHADFIRRLKDKDAPISCTDTRVIIGQVDEAYNNALKLLLHMNIPRREYVATTMNKVGVIIQLYNKAPAITRSAYAAEIQVLEQLGIVYANIDKNPFYGIVQLYDALSASEMSARIINLYEDFKGAVRVYIKLNVDQPTITALGAHLRDTEIAVRTANATGVSFVNSACLKDLPDATWTWSGEKCPDQTCGPFYTVYPHVRPDDQTREFTTKDMFDDMKSVFSQVSNGYHIVIFGTGFSGSGKTYTLFGKGGAKPIYGITQLALEHIRTELKSDSISISDIYDLYGLKKAESTNPTFIKSLHNTYKGAILTIADVIKTVETINKSRMELGIEHVKPTPNNIESSRGHLAITFSFAKSGRIVGGKLTVIDMGGSENTDNIYKVYKETPYSDDFHFDLIPKFRNVSSKDYDKLREIIQAAISNKSIEQVIQGQVTTSDISAIMSKSADLRKYDTRLASVASDYIKGIISKVLQEGQYINLTISQMQQYFETKIREGNAAAALLAQKDDKNREDGKIDRAAFGSMFSMLRSFENANPNIPKPTKFINMILIKNSVENMDFKAGKIVHSTKYCNGASEAIDFALKVNSAKTV